MPDLLGILGTVRDLLVFLIGFGLIVFVHELGHFLAARWAGIRVQTFAIGFGTAIVSFRKGLGLRRGSSAREYHALAEAHVRSGHSIDATGGVINGVSPTEYRINWLPFGGYVKMLGQEDLDPNAISAAPDGYQRAKPWKRLIVISAGVVMNIIFAGVLFVIVYLAGKQTEPATVGDTVPNLPASRAVAANAVELGVSGIGLQPGDQILAIDDHPAREFNDVMIGAAMAAPNEPVTLLVRRPGIDRTLRFDVAPRVSQFTGLLELGIAPPRSSTLFETKNAREGAAFEKLIASEHLEGVCPGAILTSINGVPTDGVLNELVRAARASDGRPLRLTFEHDGQSKEFTLPPRAELETTLAERAKQGSMTSVEHLLGLVGVIKVANIEDTSPGYKAGLRTGDVFARIGNIEYPSLLRAIDEIKAHAKQTVSLVVLRNDAGVWREIPIQAPVNKDGLIGFAPADTLRDSAMVALPLPRVDRESTKIVPAAASLISTPGTTITAVAGRAVSNIADIRAALLDATRVAHAEAHSEPVKIELRLPPSASGNPRTTTIDWTLSYDDIKTLHALGWDTPINTALFKPAYVTRKAASPWQAIEFGLADTKRVMATTYLTFLRLFQQTVKIEHLKGPVGIAHIGTMVAERGFIHLLFFMALISVNLAVVNFLPLPIVDGGQFLLILAEMARGKPVPAAVQSGLTLAGLALIGCVFLVVTFNDVKQLLGL